MSTFRSWFDRQLHSRRMTNAEFARKAGVSAQMVSNYRSGSIPGTGKLAAIADALGMSEEEASKGFNSEWPLDTGGENQAEATGNDNGTESSGLRRAHVELHDTSPPPGRDGARVPIVALYDESGRRFGTRYLVSEVDFVPYAVTVHPDGRETPLGATEIVSPSDA